MIYHLNAADFTEWRAQAKQLLGNNIKPSEVSWTHNGQQALFAKPLPTAADILPFHISAEFLPFAQTIACHRSAERWGMLYQLLYRLTHGEKHLLKIGSDPLMHRLDMMEKAIRRDAHKMKAFVRFRKVEEEDGEHFIAWHQPDHYIVRRVSPFFARRFSAMKWSILTPDDSVHWDEKHLHFTQGTDRSAAPDKDTLEDLWRTYYRSTFNPARIKLKTMKREMPVRHWKTLPETDIIADMLAEAPDRVQGMLRHSEGSIVTAADYIPKTEKLTQLRKAAIGCEGCELFKPATQTVFGEGLPGASIMFVGEQPGSEEDKQGRPFIGPAGGLLQTALTDAGLKREDVYITNAVKHFRFTQQGTLRLHKAPLHQHVHACRPWLTAEINIIRPQVIICLGNTAARALLGPGFAMKTGRGIWHDDNPAVIATYHPAAILRAEGGEREQLQRTMFEDIRAAAKRARDKVPT